MILGETEFQKEKEGRGSRTFIFTVIMISELIESVNEKVKEWNLTSEQTIGFIEIVIEPDEADRLGIVALTKV